MVTCALVSTCNLIFVRLFAQIVKLRAWFQTIKYVDNDGWFSRNCMPPTIVKPLVMRTNTCLF